MTQVSSAIELTVNGERRRVHVDPDVPLLYVLRNELGLVGARFGCGTGVCGTCTVIVGGCAVRSCQIAVCAVRRGVTTVGLLDCADPLHRARITGQAGECGHCLTGLRES